MTDTNEWNAKLEQGMQLHCNYEQTSRDQIKALFVEGPPCAKCQYWVPVANSCECSMCMAETMKRNFSCFVPKG